MSDPSGIVATFTKLAQEFHHQVGLALTVWAHIDEELFLTLFAVLNGEQLHAAIIYYRTPTLDARLSLVDEITRTVFPKPERESGGHPSEGEKKWDRLVKDIRSELQIRNQIAHSPSAPVAGARTVAEGSLRPDFWYASYISSTERLRGRDIKKDLLLKDVENHVNRVGGLTLRLLTFRERELPVLLE